MPEQNRKGLNLFSKLFSKVTNSGPAEDSAAAKKSSVPELKVLFFIVDWNRAAVITRVFVENNVGLYFTHRGKGTASSDILDLLGIGAGDKAVVICLERSAMVPVLMREARKAIGFYNVGAGIAFTVPLSGINGPLLRIFSRDENAASASAPRPDGGPDWNGPERRRAERKAPGESHELIIAIINRGYSDAFMNTARAAGAGGGTVISARGRSRGEAVKVFGISVQDEKEAILILSGREKKTPIMEAVRNAHGPDSRAQGIVFSLPVDSVMGLSLEYPAEINFQK